MHKNISPLIKLQRPDDYLARPLRAAIFMSGAGSNAEQLLNTRAMLAANWLPVAIVTDHPLKSRAAELSAKYSIPLVNADIKKFYSKHNAPDTSLATESGRKIRELWTEELLIQLLTFKIDFGILAGFVSMTNLTGHFPCLNVHPGDLTVTGSGRRLLTGLNTLPIETALLHGLSSLRSSVILAQPYTGVGAEMDSGPILGISAPMPVDTGSVTVEELRSIMQSRPKPRPRGGYNDLLAEFAAQHQERLKAAGDWQVFPPVVADFAAGKFGQDSSRQLYFRDDAEWTPVKTVEYSNTGRKIIHE